MLMFKEQVFIFLLAFFAMNTVIEVVQTTYKLNPKLELNKNCSSLHGHLQPMGAHSEQMEKQVEIITEWPNGLEFWSQYISSGLPVQCKGCYDASEMDKWTDMYLREHYGKTKVNVELHKKENRKSKATPMRLEDFIDSYKKDGRYLIDSVPLDLFYNVKLPACLECGTLQKALAEVVVWLSDGGTKSVLHTDSFDNIHCVISGTKTFLLANRTFGPSVLDSPSKGYSTADVESVDMCRHPWMHRVSWLRTTVEAGSCLYIPFLWLHQVNSLEGRNLAINFWLHHLLWVDLSDRSCISNLHYLFSPDETQLEKKFNLIRLVEGFQQLVHNDFEQIFFMKNANTKEELRQLFTKMDIDRSGDVSLEELYKYDTQDFLAYFPIKEETEEG